MQRSAGSEPSPNGLVQQAFGKPGQDCTEELHEVPSALTVSEASISKVPPSSKHLHKAEKQGKVDVTEI